MCMIGCSGLRNRGKGGEVDKKILAVSAEGAIHHCMMVIDDSCQDLLSGGCLIMVGEYIIDA